MIESQGAQALLDFGIAILGNDFDDDIHIIRGPHRRQLGVIEQQPDD
jgi:hypothetical protein